MECGQCERSCPILSLQENTGKPEAWACVCREEEIRRKSSSGGVFTLLAERILERGGIVFGAAFDRDWNVVHVPVEKKEELEKLRGSKYIQSRTGDCYRDVKSWLKSGRLVYFSGTPCQIDGLKAFLKADYDNLYCQDLICHGAPSPRVWRTYLGGLRGQGEWESIFFREKSAGWRDYCVSISDGQGSRRQRYLDNPYMKLFLNAVSLRPSCYLCHSKGYGRHSDLTLGDFWGAEKIVPDMDDDGGISLVLLQTPKGKRLLEEVGDRLYRRRVDLKKAGRGNPSLLRPPGRPAEKRERLFCELDAEKLSEEEFTRLAERLTEKTLWGKGKEALWKLLKAFL